VNGASEREYLNDESNLLIAAVGGMYRWRKQTYDMTTRRIWPQKEHHDFGQRDVAVSRRTSTNNITASPKQPASSSVN
jgi:hypothetical protein